MKKTIATSLLSAVAALLLASPATAGTLTIDNGPNFTPPDDFTNNTIMLAPSIEQGSLVQITGHATVTPASSTVATIRCTPPGNGATTTIPAGEKYRITSSLGTPPVSRTSASTNDSP